MAVRQARNSNRESRGYSPPTWTRGGHILWGTNYGTEPLTVLTEPLPVPGVGRQRPRTRGGDGTPNPAPFAGVYSAAADRGRVRSMARPVSPASKGRGRTHPFGRSPLLLSGDRAGVEPQAGESPTDWRRHAPTAPTWRSRTRYSHTGGSYRRGQTDRPDAPRWNPRASARGGCQELRKRIKYHRYYTRLLRRVWVDPMKERRSRLIRSCVTLYRYGIAR